MPPVERIHSLERIMHRVAVVVSVVAVLLMATGFGYTFLLHPMPAIPGAPALPPGEVWHLDAPDWGIWAMSMGILLLALLPPLRVLLALVLFLRKRDLLDVAVALIVLAELLISMRVKG